MSNIATTIEQSKHLLELGLSKETADMSYSEEYFGKDKDGNDEWCWRLNACKFIDVEGIIPAWSLSALLEVMPTTIEIDGLRYDLELFKAIDDDTDLPYYGVKYVYNDDYHLDYYESGSNIIEQAFAMVCILIEQGLIKKGGEE